MTALATATAHRAWQASTAGEYTFKDIGELCAFLQHEIQTSKRKYNKIAEAAGCCSATVSNMVHGVTHYPRAATVFQLLKVLGYEVVVRG